MHYVRRRRVFASLFTCGIAVPHMIASGDERLIDTYAAHAARRTRSGRWRSPSPAAAPDVGHLTTRATRDGDDYIVNGAKTPSSPGARRLCRDRGAHRRPGAAGVADRRRQGHTGLRGEPQAGQDGLAVLDTAELSYTDVRVPAANLIGGENTGFAQIAGAFVSERVGLAAQAYASAQRCLDLTARWCRTARPSAGR